MLETKIKYIHLMCFYADTLNKCESKKAFVLALQRAPWFLSIVCRLHCES